MPTGTYKRSDVRSHFVHVSLNVYSIARFNSEQVPLLLAWALTIHKSQGQTLERVKVNLQQVFLPGQGESRISPVSDSFN